MYQRCRTTIRNDAPALRRTVHKIFLAKISICVLLYLRMTFHLFKIFWRPLYVCLEKMQFVKRYTGVWCFPYDDFFVSIYDVAYVAFCTCIFNKVKLMSKKYPIIMGMGYKILLGAILACVYHTRISSAGWSGWKLTKFQLMEIHNGSVKIIESSKERK